MFVSFFFFGFLAALSLAGCASVDAGGKADAPHFRDVGSISEIEGVWLGDGGRVVEFPVVADGTRFLRVSDVPFDATGEWKKICAEEGIAYDFEAMWQRRFALADGYPKADSRGVQVGIVMARRNVGGENRVFYSLTHLVPAAVAEDNLSNFQIDGESLAVFGIMTLGSDRVPDIDFSSFGSGVLRRKE